MCRSSKVVTPARMPGIQPQTQGQLPCSILQHSSELPQGVPLHSLIPTLQAYCMWRADHAHRAHPVGASSCNRCPPHHSTRSCCESVCSWSPSKRSTHARVMLQASSSFQAGAPSLPHAPAVPQRAAGPGQACACGGATCGPALWVVQACHRNPHASATGTAGRMFCLVLLLQRWSALPVGWRRSVWFDTGLGGLAADLVALQPARLMPADLLQGFCEYTYEVAL